MKRNTRTHRVLLVFRLIRFLTDDFEYGNGNSDPCRPVHMFLLFYLVMKRDKRHWRAVPQSHSTVFRDTAASSSEAPIGTVGRYPSCVPPQGPFEQSEQCRSKLWKRLNDAAGIRQQGCDVRTHDAESVTSVCSEHHCRMACSGAYRIFLAEED